MEVNLGIISATIVNFIILYWILKHFFFNKVKSIIEAREEYINESLDSAEEATVRGRMLVIENERLLKQAKKEGKKIIENEKQKAEKIYSEIVEEAKVEANLILDRARIEINREKEKVEYGLKKEAIELALELSKKVIEKNIDEEKNRQLINDFISEVGK